MKVPNKVLQAIIKVSPSLPESEEKQLILAWAQEGIVKRSQPAAVQATASK